MKFVVEKFSSLQNLKKKKKQPKTFPCCLINVYKIHRKCLEMRCLGSEGRGRRKEEVNFSSSGQAFVGFMYADDDFEQSAFESIHSSSEKFCDEADYIILIASTDERLPIYYCLYMK